MKYIDTHSHLSFPAFDDDRDAVIARMREQGVGSIDIGTTLETSRAAVALAGEYEHIWAAVGIHPSHAHADRFHDANELREAPKGPEVFEKELFTDLTKQEKVVAVGECGLDYYRIDADDGETKKKQKELFEKHIALAKKAALPLVIHCRPSAGTHDAYDDLHDILAAHAGLSGTVHFFVGSAEYAKQFVDLGFHISFSGVITFADEYEAVVRSVPLERILAETDCPYAAPAPYRGKRNEPVYVLPVIEKIATVHGVSTDTAAHQTTKNAQELFVLAV